MIERIAGDFGYAALFLGTFFEGEIALLIAAFAAHEQYLRRPLVMLTAFAGSFCGNQIWFELARRYGLRCIEQHPAWVDRPARLASASPPAEPFLFSALGSSTASDFSRRLRAHSRAFHRRALL
jgi:hypothetical protein